MRNRPDLQQLTDELQGLGATLVTTEERANGDLAAAQLPRPRLGLNCVGGSSSAAVAKALMCGCENNSGLSDVVVFLQFDKPQVLTTYG